ncbi:hypothetical protein AVEN_274811-1, partial [Araneus ventricosus]
NSRRRTPKFGRSIVNKERNHFSPVKFTQVPKPPESGVCRMGRFEAG